MPVFGPSVDIVGDSARFVAQDKSIGCHATLPILMRLAREKSTGAYDRGLSDRRLHERGRAGGACIPARERGHDPREWDKASCSLLG